MGAKERLVIVDGYRTPFCKSGTLLKNATASDLATHVFREVIDRTGIDPELIDEVILGCAGPGPNEANVAMGFDFAGATTAVVALALPARMSSMVIRASPISRTRRLASFSRQRSMRCFNAGGVSDGSFSKSGSARRTAANVSEIVSPLNVISPVSISNMTAP